MWTDPPNAPAKILRMRGEQFQRTIQRVGRAAFFAALVLWLTACAGSQVPPPGGAPLTQVVSPPEWRPGDRWVYEWTSGTETGTKTAEVIEIKALNNVRYYVVRIGEVDHYYTLDLQWAGSVRDSKVEARMVPPQPWFVWPLEVGRSWAHHGVYELANDKTSYDDTFSVVTAETVEVPAGRFPALKAVRETNRRDADQYWYAPEVRWYVKWSGRRGDAHFEERLREHHAAPRLISPRPPSTPPSTPK